MYTSHPSDFLFPHFRLLHFSPDDDGPMFHLQIHVCLCINYPIISSGYSYAVASQQRHDDDWIASRT